MKKYSFKPMLQSEAEKISKWHYEGIYSFYDQKNDPEDLEELLDPITRNKGNYHAAICETGELVGYMCYEANAGAVIVGLGLRPDLTGKGFGKGFLISIIDYVKERENSETIELSVASFNERAIRLYEGEGFKAVGTFIQETNGGKYEFKKMRKNLGSDSLR